MARRAYFFVGPLRTPRVENAQSQQRLAEKRFNYFKIPRGKAIWRRLTIFDGEERRNGISLRLAMAPCRKPDVDFPP
jgi:hypothetical protein